MPDPTRDEELLSRAANGDLHAAGKLLAPMLPGLLPAAKRLAGDAIDPEDLLAEAVAAVLAKWADGAGPRDGVRNYLLQTMRNRALDEATSPRSRTRPLEFDVIDVESTPPDATLDLDHELDALRLALARLPEAQRTLLTETYHGGAKSRDLSEQQHRSAGAVYSLHSRAKAALRRAYLQVMLEEGAPPSCQHAIASLPTRIAASPDETEGVPAHISKCARCRHGWARFAVVWAALGVAPLLVLATPEAVPAATVGGGSSGSDDASVGGEANAVTEHDIGVAETSPVRPGAVAATSAKPLLLVGAALCTVGVVIGVIATVQQFGSSDAAVSAAQQDFGTAEFGSAPGTAQTGATAAADAAVADTDARTGTISGTMTLYISESAGKERTAKLDFALADVEWQVDSVTFALPSGVALASAPDGWSCDNSAICRSDNKNAPGGTFVLAGAPANATKAAEFAVQWLAHSGERTVTSTVGGPYPAPDEPLSVRAEAKQGSSSN